MARRGSGSHGGTAQLDLEGFAPPQRATDRLFFAIFPDGPAAAQITALAARLAHTHGLRGRPLDTARLHITLHHLGDFVGLPPGVVQAGTQAAGSVDWRGFEVCFDRAASFVGRIGNLPFVLQGGAALDALKDFQQQLGAALHRVGQKGDAAARFVPHVTLLYDDQLVLDQAVEPVTWRASELVLVHSLIGQTRHIVLGRWPLL